MRNRSKKSAIGTLFKRCEIQTFNQFKTKKMLTKGFIIGCISASATATATKIAVSENWEAIEKYNIALAQTDTVVGRPNLLKRTGFA